MGQLVIEIPQNVKRFYQVRDAEVGERLMRDLEESSDAAEDQAIIPPRRNSLKEDLANVVGIWADRKESADEIAREIRDKNNGKI